MAHSVIDITGNWQFKEYPLSARRMRDLDANDWFDCTCPNSIYINLIDADQIDENDLLANPEHYKWVSEKPWIFRKTFDITKQMLESDKIELTCDGLDTIASVWLNEKLLGKTDNMFIPHRFDITKYRKPKGNVLLIKFESAVNHAKKLMKQYTPFSEEDFAHPYRSYIRKAQFQFGWDFCPSLPGCGIWKPVRIEGIKDAQIDNLHIRTVNCTTKSADIRIAVDIKSKTNKKLLCKAEIFAPDENHIQNLEFEPHKGSGSAVFHIQHPQLWWPAGYGSQNLYKFQVSLLADGVLVDRKINRFGIRTLNLNQSPDKNGNCFQFEINTAPIYAKGANWVPASIFTGSVTETDYRKLLTAAADANINMLRVWGGGYYEDDLFYQICDELGIMVWQDFMFACAYYPDRHWFLKQISTEVKSSVRRLYNHPSLVLYCGNNEIHWMFENQKKGRGRKFHGKTIFDKLLPKLLTELDPDRPYIHSTPFSVKGHPNEPDSGTIHNWDIWAFHKPVRNYITELQKAPRFVTEFGSQSLPSLETLSCTCPPEKMKVAALEIEKHNYQLDGSSRLCRYTADIFKPTDDLKKFIHLTQLAQARAAKTHIEFLRACNPKNSGVLFWQFNDVYPATTWSAVDYSKNPKALYYYARRFFSPLLITIVPQYKHPQHFGMVDLDWLGVVIVNDSDKPVTGKIICRLIDFHGNVIDSMQLPAAVAPFSTLRPVKLPKALTFPAKPSKVTLQAVLEKDKTNIAQNLFFFLPDKHIEFPQPNIQQQITCTENNNAVVTLSSDVLARDVFIKTHNSIELSDNYLDILPNEPRQIELKFNSVAEEAKQEIKSYSVI